MSDPQLLLERLAGWHDKDAVVGSETESWQAYAEAKQLDDLSIMQPILDILVENKEPALRKYAFEVLTFLLKNSQDKDLSSHLISSLRAEDQQEESLYALLMGLWESEVLFEEGLDEVLFYVDDPRALIRNAAIRLVGRFQAQLKEAKKALQEVVENHYDEYDLRYAKQSLQAIEQRGQA
ncbi:MAG: hypothetical protein AAF466_02195 [Bacteroidota bacterium]